METDLEAKALNDCKRGGSFHALKSDGLFASISKCSQDKHERYRCDSKVVISKESLAYGARFNSNWLMLTGLTDT